MRVPFWIKYLEAQYTIFGKFLGTMSLRGRKDTTTTLRYQLRDEILYDAQLEESIEEINMHINPEEIVPLTRSQALRAPMEVTIPSQSHEEDNEEGSDNDLSLSESDSIEASQTQPKDTAPQQLADPTYMSLHGPPKHEMVCTEHERVL